MSDTWSNLITGAQKTGDKYADALIEAYVQQQLEVMHVMQSLSSCVGKESHCRKETKVDYYRLTFTDPLCITPSGNVKFSGVLILTKDNISIQYTVTKIISGVETTVVATDCDNASDILKNWLRCQ